MNEVSDCQTVRQSVQPDAAVAAETINFPGATRL